MVTLRFARAGTTKRPVFHLVVTDSRNRRDGSFIEKLGYYIPQRKIVVLKHDRIQHWVSKGAQLSETAKHLVAKSKKSGTAAEGASA